MCVFITKLILNYIMKIWKGETQVIGKNNKNLRNQKDGVKVESYSIKKFKVGGGFGCNWC